MNQRYNWNYKGIHCGVYCITNQITNEQYIGISNDILSRWRHHIYASKKSGEKEYNYPLMCDFRKYGYENFSFVILEEVEQSMLSIKEKEYIALYNPIYNQTCGGRGGNRNIPVYLDDLIKDLQENKLTFAEIAQKYNYSSEDTICRINQGRCWRQDNLSYPIRTMKDIVTRIRHKEVIQLNKKTGEEIKLWYSATEAALSLGITDHNAPSHINQCCKGQRKSAYGYRWKYPDKTL